METIATNVATDLAQRMVDRVKREAHYLCCFHGYVENFENERDRLSAKQKGVQKDIEDAKKRNENQVRDEVLQWQNEAGGLIQEDTKTRKKWLYGWCPNCIWQHRRGKELARKTMEIKELINRCNFNRMARPAEPPGMKYYSSSQDFIDFESRELVFNNLVEALKDENCCMIGLQGMGGAGKTTLAIEVGKKVEESKIFDRVIFVVVSNTPDFKMIQRDLARQLDLPLEEGKERGHSEILWTRIANTEGKLLIILDDIWGEFNLIKDIGIPSDHYHNVCKVLITTRDSKVCKDMGCQQIIQLTTLTDEDALKLFLKHGNISGDASSSSNLKAMALDIIKECGGLPVAIVAVANTLRNWPLRDWKEALRTLQNSEPLCDVHEDLTKVYKCLSLSYDNLSEHAKQFFLLCSLFPEDYEIPIELLNIIGIGVGLFGAVDKYYAMRSQVLGVKNELICSSLLLENDEECVKMHDLVREVALWITNEGVQAINDSKTALKKNLQYLFWYNDSLPNRFDCAKLEILLLEITVKGALEVPETFFGEMKRLRVLHLGNCSWGHPTLSLSQSLQLLKDIRVLMLVDWDLGDISILGNLQSLEALMLVGCSIIEFPKDIEELKKLRLLKLKCCRIGRNNPFDVIERCSELEELYFVVNEYYLHWEPQDGTENKDEVPEKRSPPALQKYYIGDENQEIVGTTSRFFDSKNLKYLISEAMFKYLVGRAEVLGLGEMGETGWNNLIHVIALTEDRGMNDLIKLSLYSLADIECLIDTSKHPYSIVTAFSKLIELHLCEVNVQELYRGSVASHFLEKLQILKLKKCTKLQSVILFNGQFNLCHLKVVELEDCPMLTSLFQPDSCQSLVQLETLKIKKCNKLKHIIMDESSEEEIVDDENRKSHNLLFPKLRDLQIARCNKLELLLPLLFAGDLPLLEGIIISECEELKYIFGEYRDEDEVVHQNEERIMLPSLESMELSEVPSFINIFRCTKYKAMSSISMQRASSVSISGNKEEHPYPKSRAFPWSHVCCFLPTAKEANVVSNATLQDHTISPEIHTLKWVQTFYSAECLLSRPLNLQNTREMKLVNCSKLMSLFSFSIATTMLLKKLTILKCHNLKHIISNYKDEDCGSIFPKLEKLEIKNCNMLEILFPSNISGGLQKLKYMHIERARELRYVIGNHQHEDFSSNQTKNDELHIDLSPMEMLRLISVPKIISICSLEGQHNLETPKELHASAELVQTSHILQSLWGQPILNLHNIRHMELVNCSHSVSLFSLSMATMMLLEKLTIRQCHQLKHIISNNMEEDHDHVNHCSSIFPKLMILKIENCGKLEILFPSTISGGLQKLKYMHIKHAPALKHIISNNKRKDHDHINYCSSIFPKLEKLQITFCNRLEFLFPSTISRGLQKLRYMHIDYARELRYVFGNNHHEDYSSYQTKNDEFPIDLSAMETLTLTNVPKIISICSHEGETSEELHTTVESVQTFHKVQCLWGQPGPNLQNTREMEFVNCSSLISLFSLSIATTMLLGKLIICECHNLKYIISNNKGEDHDHINYCSSIFPKLEKLEIKNCNKLEILFPSTISGGLQKLKYMHIEDAPELRYVIRNRHHEDYSSNQTKNDELHIDLSAMEMLNLINVPKIISICSHEGQQNLKTPKALHSSTGGIPPINTACLLGQPLKLHNVRAMRFRNLSNLTSLFTLAIASALTNLKSLSIQECHNLKYIIADEEDAQHHVNYRSIFPNLEELYVRDCVALVFPAHILGSLVHLKNLNIRNAPEFKYASRNQNIDHLHFDLPALQRLCLEDVPNVVSICWHQRQLQDCTTTKASNMRMQNFTSGIKLEINREGLEAKGPPAISTLKFLTLKNLSELRHMCKGPKYILSLHNLEWLEISACKKLRAIFSASTLRSLPQLFQLEISDCEELVHIIEEDFEESNIDYDDLDQPRFPNLEILFIKRCNSLKWLFSISTSNVFPKLKHLTIEDACELEQVFIRQQGDAQKMMLRTVFQNLRFITLIKLPRLGTICEGIDFQTVRHCKVLHCPKYQDSESQATTKIQLSVHSNTDRATPQNMAPSDMGDANGRQGLAIQELASDSPNSIKNTGEITKEIVEVLISEISTISTMATSSSDSAFVRGLNVKETSNGLTQTLDKQASATSLAELELSRPSLDLEDEQSMREEQKYGETKITHEAPQKTNIPCDDRIHAMVKGRVQEGPACNDVMAAPLLADSARRDSSKGTLVSPLQEEFPLALRKEESKSETLMTHQQAPRETESIAIESVPEDNSSINAKMVTSLTHSQLRASHLGLSTPVIQSINVTMAQCPQEQYARDEAITTNQTTDADSMQQSTRSLVNLIEKESAKSTKEVASQIVAKIPNLEISPIASPLDSEFFRALTIKEKRDTSVEASLKLEKASEANLLTYSRGYTTDPSEDNVVLADAISSLHYQSQIGVVDPSTSMSDIPPILGICEIFQSVELKDGEEALLAKALEQYPQLRLPREQRTNPVIAFSYRVLVDILVILASKTPFTITASDKETLEANLGAATFCGFDKDWIASVRANVFDSDVSQTVTVEEEIRVMEVELEAIDTQLMGLLEDRKKLVTKMAEFRKIRSARDKPFGF